MPRPEFDSCLMKSDELLEQLDRGSRLTDTIIKRSRALIEDSRLLLSQGASGSEPREVVVGQGDGHAAKRGKDPHHGPPQSEG